MSLILFIVIPAICGALTWIYLYRMPVKPLAPDNPPSAAVPRSAVASAASQPAFADARSQKAVVTLGGTFITTRDFSSFKDGYAEPFDFWGFKPIQLHINDGVLYCNLRSWQSRDHQGVEITDGKFTVWPPQWDWNFSDTEFEVVDENQKPVLQVIRKAPNYFYVYGLLVLPGGVLVARKESTDATPWGSLVGTPKIDLPPIFKYPSRRFPGQYVESHTMATREIEKDREQPLRIEPKVDVKVERGKPTKTEGSPRTEDALAKIAADLGEIKTRIDKKPQREVEKDANETASATDSATIRKIPGPMLADIRIASQTRVLSTDHNLPYALEVVIQTNQSVQPVAFAVECDGDIGEGRAGFRAGGVYTKTKSGLAKGRSNVFIFEWDAPVFTADSPIVVTLLSRTGIRAIKLHKIDYAWP